MSERPPTAGSPDDELSDEPEAADEAREAALIRKVIRMQRRHREGGAGPDTDEEQEVSEPDA